MITIVPYSTFQRTGRLRRVAAGSSSQATRHPQRSPQAVLLAAGGVRAGLVLRTTAITLTGREFGISQATDARWGGDMGDISDIQYPWMALPSVMEDLIAPSVTFVLGIVGTSGG
jgi:hypothetical protein